MAPRSPLHGPTLILRLLGAAAFAAQAAALRAAGRAAQLPAGDVALDIPRDASNDGFLDDGFSGFEAEEDALIGFEKGRKRCMSRLVYDAQWPQGDNWRINCTGSLCKPQDSEEQWWVDEPPEQKADKSGFLAEQRIVKPKLAVLMMANDSVANDQTWVRWLDGAKKAGLSVNFHIHAKDIKGARWRTPSLRDYVLNKSSSKTDNRWCKVGPAEWLLLETALQDPEVTHFAMTSSDSIPVKSLSYMHREIQKEPATRMCMDWDDHPPLRTPRAETWFLMHRADAQLFVKHESWCRQKFMTHNMCQEERIWNMPLVLRSFRWGQSKAPLIDSCVMFTDWGDQPCKSWGIHVLMGDFTQLRSKSEYTDAKGDVHPRTYLHATPEGHKELQDSSFWFARKFAHNAVNPSLFNFE